MRARRAAEGRGPAGKTQPLDLLTGAVSKIEMPVWQDVNSHCKPVVCPRPAMVRPGSPPASLKYISTAVSF